jgi:hypothetical protein
VTCREVKKLLPQLIDDALDEGQRTSVDEHVDSCSECGQLVRQLDDSLALFVAHQPDVEAPDTEKLWRRVRSEAFEQTDGRRRLWSSVLVPSLAAATAVIALAIVLWPSPRDTGSLDPRMASVSSNSTARMSDASEPTPLPTPADSSNAAEPDSAVTDATPDATPTIVVSTPPPGGTGSLLPVDSSTQPPRATEGLSLAGWSTPSPGGTGSSLPVDSDAAAEPTELHDYALVVAEWTVREYDSVVTFAESDGDLGDAEAEPVRTSLYAIVPGSYSVRSTECVYDAAIELPAITYAETSPPDDPAPEDGTDTSDAGPVLGASVHTL